MEEDILVNKIFIFTSGANDGRVEGVFFESCSCGMTPARESHGRCWSLTYDA